MRIINVIRVRNGLPVDIYNFVDDMDGAVGMFSNLAAESGERFHDGLMLEAALDTGYVITSEGSVSFNVDSCPSVKASGTSETQDGG